MLSGLPHVQASRVLPSFLAARHRRQAKFISSVPMACLAWETAMPQVQRLSWVGSRWLEQDRGETSVH